MHSPGGGGVRGQLWFCDLDGVLALHGEMRSNMCVLMLTCLYFLRIHNNGRVLGTLL